MKVFVGFSPEEMDATVVAEYSIRRSCRHRPDVQRISRLTLGDVYRRPTQQTASGLWDVISDAPMSTDHAIARFFVPWLCNYSGWALFTDGDILCRRDLADLTPYMDERHAVVCVQHPTINTGDTKKDGAVQTSYPRKNWSSVMLWNCGHASNTFLSLQRLNKLTGRDLHSFSWLYDNEIGALPPEWNYLVNVTDPAPVDPAIVHFTLGYPRLVGHESDPFAEEWFDCARMCGYRFSRKGVVNA